ncbi:hypothetical protein G6F22_018798 [Rhizopus arrhizus]|nr:hypothetical protein G6F22_018798 [Rhizopus arrhizus]
MGPGAAPAEPAGAAGFGHRRLADRTRRRPGRQSGHRTGRRTAVLEWRARAQHRASEGCAVQGGQDRCPVGSARRRQDLRSGADRLNLTASVTPRRAACPARRPRKPAVRGRLRQCAPRWASQRDRTRSAAHWPLAAPGTGRRWSACRRGRNGPWRWIAPVALPALPAPDAPNACTRRSWRLRPRPACA